MTDFSIDEIPFSYHGSWFNISRVVANARYADDLHLISHQTGLHPILQLIPTFGGQHVQADIGAQPAVLTWRVGEASIRAAYDGASTLRLRGEGLGLILRATDETLTPFSGPYLYRDPRDGAYVFSLYETGRRYRITILSAATVDAIGLQALGSAERSVHLPEELPWEIAVEELKTSSPPFATDRSFAEVAARSQRDFAEFADQVAPFHGGQYPAAELAAYTLWSATVQPDGFLTRPAVLMSKHWMDKVWSWDHCFNALALAGADQSLAWDQFLTVFDHQDSSGAVPDSVAHSEILYNYVKPPIHGWALRQLRQRMPRALTQDQLRMAYDKLAAWTRFWLDHRRAPGHQLPHYQHGNDSGWDNSTTFAQHRLIETADLAAFLVVQIDMLTDLAGDLQLASEALDWERLGQQLLTSLIDELWVGDRFVARDVESSDAWTSKSLLDLMPIVLAGALPDAVGKHLADHIRAHLAPAGLATERTDSDLYEPDGYWRGPVWAPSTILIEDGLRRSGHHELADEVSVRFRAVCERSGFAENFDAITGAGLRDRAYTWTASAYLLLCGDAEARAALASSEPVSP